MRVKINKGKDFEIFEIDEVKYEKLKKVAWRDVTLKFLLVVTGLTILVLLYQAVMGVIFKEISILLSALLGMLAVAVKYLFGKPPDQGRNGDDGRRAQTPGEDGNGGGDGGAGARADEKETDIHGD